MHNLFFTNFLKPRIIINFGSFYNGWNLLIKDIGPLGNGGLRPRHGANTERSEYSLKSIKFPREI